MSEQFPAAEPADQPPEARHAPESDQPPEIWHPVETGHPPETGHPAVDASLRELAQAAGAAPAEQLPAYQAAHRTLRETLAGIDEAVSPG